MIKRVLSIILTIALYEATKYITNEVIVKLQSVDDVDIPTDYIKEDSF